MASSIVRKLEVLRYTGVPQINLKFEDARQFKIIVIFLEEEQIRLYEPPLRHPLRLVDNKSASEYAQVLADYLSELEAPQLIVDLAAAASSPSTLPDANAARQMILEFLASEAVRVKYSDQLMAYNQGVSAALSGASPAPHAAPADEADAHAEMIRVLDALNPLMKAFRLPLFDRDAVTTAEDVEDPAAVTRSTLEAAARELSRRAANELAPFKYNLDAERARPLASAGASPGEVLTRRKSTRRPLVVPDLSAEEARARIKDLETLRIGRDEVNEAIAVMRLVHTFELKRLQQTLNEIISMCQEVTANPATDVSLGRVGR